MISTNNRAEDFIASRSDVFIAHYASEYYDPVKAKEYYERTKELKGRQSTKGMSDTQKQALSYTKNQISASKKATLEKARAEQKEKMEAIRNVAESSRSRITDKLNALLDQIKSKVAVIPKPEVKQTPLNVIPSNASPQLRAYLEKQNAAIQQHNKKAVDKANADYRVKVQAAQKVASDNSVAARKAAGAEMKRIGTDAKAAITKARATYEATKKQTDAKYKQASDKEYQNIKTQLPSAPPKVKKPKTPRQRSTTKEGEPSK